MPPTLRLLRPAYRRWLTPDMHDLEFEVVGPLERTPLQVRYFVRDTDSDKETLQTTPLTLDGGRFYLPAPKLHHRAELIVFVERKRDREPLVDGRWTMFGVDADRAKELTYFDGRGVLIHSGVGRFPLVARFSDLSPTQAVAQALANGYTAVALTNPTAADFAATEKAGLLVLVEMPLPHLDKIGESVKVARSASSVFGYLLKCHAAVPVAVAMDAYRAIRQADSSRPVLLMPNAVGDWANPALATFQDVAVPPADCRDRDLGFSAQGRATFDATNAPTDALAAVHAAAARGAAGAILFGTQAELAQAANRELAAALAKRIVHSIPDRDALSDPPDLWMWSRRFDNHRLIGAVDRGPAAVEVPIPNPPDGQTWHEWFAPNRTRPLTPEACRLPAGRTLTVCTSTAPAV